MTMLTPDQLAHIFAIYGLGYVGGVQPCSRCSTCHAWRRRAALGLTALEALDARLEWAASS